MDRMEAVNGDAVAGEETLRDPGLLDVQGVAGDLRGACCSSGYHRAYVADELGKSERPPKGTFLDETILLREPEGSAIISAVTARIDEQRSRGRKPQQREVENERSLIGCVVANGLRCQWYKRSPVVAYKRMAAGYSDKPHRPDWLSGRGLKRAVELLAQAGLVTTRLGQRWTASSYAVTDDLITLAGEHGVTERCLVLHLHREDLVRLRGEKPRPYWDVYKWRRVHPKAPRIYFPSKPETEVWRDILSAYNAFIADQDISVEVPAEVGTTWIDHLNKGDSYSGSPFVRPELFRRSVYRVFNDGTPHHPSFDKGGRLVGPWWINAPEDVRAQIRINGEATVELDYRACHARMLYHERGLQAPDEPYGTPEIIAYEQEAGLPQGHMRPAEKWLTQVLINGRGRPDLTAQPDDIDLSSELVRDFTAAIKHHHAPIASVFGSGAGLRLMKTESEIALAIITRAMAEGWTALPIHDSFVAPHSRAERLIQLMEEEYINKVGGQPIID